MQIALGNASAELHIEAAEISRHGSHPQLNEWPLDKFSVIFR